MGKESIKKNSRERKRASKRKMGRRGKSWDLAEREEER